MRRLAIATASGARFSPNIRMSASVRRWAPPLASSRRPSIAPSPTSSATLASVPPKPDSMTETTLEGVMPVASAVSRLTSTSAMKAWKRNAMMRMSSRAIAAAAMPSSPPVERSQRNVISSVMGSPW